jgi:pyruvate kinase
LPYYGVQQPRIAPIAQDFENAIAEAADLVRKNGMASNGGHIVVVAGMPFGIAGTTNSMRVVRI